MARTDYDGATGKVQPDYTDSGVDRTPLRRSGPYVAIAAIVVVLIGAGIFAIAARRDCSLGGGQAIVFDRQRPIGSATYVVDAETGCQDEALSLPAQARVLGQRVAYVGTRDEGKEVYVRELTGGGLRRITDSPGMNIEPAWSPDGTKIAFVSTRDGNEEIYLADAQGGGERRLTTNAGRDAQPAWSPDGTKIAFVSTRDGNEEIYVADAQGGGERRLTNFKGSDLVPQWVVRGSEFRKP